MKILLLSLLVAPLRLMGQSDSLSHSVLFKSDTLLKPIDFREIPYTYTSRSTHTYRGHSTTSYSTHSGIHRIYSYDGIDVDKPQVELWRYMDALHDPDVQEQHKQFDDITARKQTANSIGITLAIPGMIMMIIGAVQASAYKTELSKQRTAYYQAPLPTPVTSAPATPTGPNLFNCSSWIGYNGIWQCQSGPYAGQKVTQDPFTTSVPTPTPVPPQPIVPAGPPTTVNLPDGKGLIIGGFAAVFVGMCVGVSARGDAGATFLKAVQYYNRGLKQKFSWEMQPYSQFGATGMSLVGHF